MPVRPVRRALLSVSDKTGLIDLARGLAELGVELISTGGTRAALTAAGLAVRDISDLTGFPEILGGRVKTLHPHVHGGILAVRDDPDHTTTLDTHGIGVIDLVVCNLYPFERVAAMSGSNHETIVANIDIGGPTLVRAGAKNHSFVAVLTDPAQYASFLVELREHGGTTAATRETLARVAFARVASYDHAISRYFTRRATDEVFPPTLLLRADRRQVLRYGENPHQQAAFYVEPGQRFPCVAHADILHGKELSYNNLLDLDNALSLVRQFASPAAAIIKHNNPCGVGLAETLADAFRKAYEGDPLSAFGGVLAFNAEVDEATALQITEPNRFIECIIAPSYSEAGFQVLTTRPSWKKSVRLLRTGPLAQGWPPLLEVRRVDGGYLVQTPDRLGDEAVHPKVVTKRAPTDAELAELRFAWIVCKSVKSNAIVLAKEGMVVGVGAGQMSRVDSVQLAVRKAGERVRGTVLASDAFFPFRDNVDEAARAGVSAIIQPGGSVRDADSIAACDAHGLAMVFTGVRHFKH